MFPIVHALITPLTRWEFLWQKTARWIHQDVHFCFKVLAGCLGVRISLYNLSSSFTFIRIFMSISVTVRPKVGYCKRCPFQVMRCRTY